MNNEKITTIEELKKYSEGEIVSIPGFVNNDPFVVRLKRPSLMRLAFEGIIPNNLLVKANELFYEDGEETRNYENKEMLREMYGVLSVMAKEAMVSPTFEEVENAGLQLTDIQLMSIFNYTQVGINMLIPFRTEQKD